MSFFPSPVLVRLQELKLWQGNYDSLIKNKSKDGTNPSDFETIEGLSGLNSPLSSPLSSPERQRGVDWDKKAISPAKPFEQLLEEKLAQDKPIRVQAKPKKPFLRKGTGLERYKLNQYNAKRPVTASENKSKVGGHVKRKVVSAPIKKKSCLKTAIIVDEEPDLTPLKMPDLVIKPKASWHKVVEENKSDNIEISNSKPEEIIKPLDDCKTPKNNFNSHIMGKINEFALKHFLSKKHLGNKNFPESEERHENNTQEKDIHEGTTENELRIFEALEERVENSSFSSTNSSIVRLLSSTPNKVKKPEIRSPILEENKHIPGDSSIDQKAINLQQKLQEVNKKTDVLHDFLKNLRKMGGGNDKKKRSKESLESDTSKSNEKSPKQTPDTSFEDEERWSSNTDGNSRSPTPSSFYTDFETTCKGDYNTHRTDVAVNTSFKDQDETTVNEKCANCEDLEKKLEEIRNRMPDIKAEKARVMDFAKELEKKRDLITKEMQKMRKDYEQELCELRKELEVERKKFTKEKMVFDTYLKDSHNRPTKKEREEICNLKKELTDVKELMKLKDTKNGASLARLRNQIKQLEKDNGELKTGIEKLQKENSKLTANQQLRKPSEVKMLHEINKNLSKLAEEAFKKQVSKSETNNDSSRSEVRRTKSDKDCRDKENDKTEREVLTKIKKKPPCLKNKVLDDVTINNAINDTCGHDMTGFVNVSLERQYENVFGQFPSPGPNNNSLNDSKKEKTETIFEDGSKEVKYSNGNTKTISPDRNLIVVRYYNGDIKETNLRENTLKYYYAENGTWHTQFGDGLELLEYANGQKEKKYKGGKSEITCPDGSFITRMPDGSEEVIYRDGSKLLKNLVGDRILLLPNGQKEIHTKEHKRREYPDGTVKILYPDGTQETRYSSGRIRIKDSKGALIMDSQNSD